MRFFTAQNYFKMINKIHSIFNRPEKGWDPIQREYGRKYAEYEWEHFAPELVDNLEIDFGSFQNKTVLDLGAGPGHYSAEFARRGAKVTWYDVSRFYADYASLRTRNMSFDHPIEYKIGYFEDALKLKMQYDLVFNRICYCYARNDFQFARIICRMIKNKGYGFIMANHLGFYKKYNIPLKLKVFINEKLGYKIGHPHCSIKRYREVFEHCSLKDFKYKFDTKSIYIWLYK